MKRLLLIISLLMSIMSWGQPKMVRLQLKEGTTMTGRIVSLNPPESVTVDIAGIETKFMLKDVESIVEVPENEIKATRVDEVLPESELKNQQFVEVTQKPDYPEMITISVGPYEIEMLLVKGGSFMMGYDKAGSKIMDSEPVHEVQLSDFYVNKRVLGNQVVSYLVNNEKKFRDSSKYTPRNWEDAKQIAEAISQQKNIPIGLITEAQCEYIVTGNYPRDLVVEKEETVFCEDYFAPYSDSHRVLIDPVGPITGRYHVVRTIDTSRDSRDKYHRYHDEFELYRKFLIIKGRGIRITVPADKLMLAQSAASSE